MYEEKECCVCSELIHPRDAWMVIKIIWVLQRREIHADDYVHVSCVAEDLLEENFRMSHPLYEVNLFIRTKWRGEFETTININYNQPIYLDVPNINYSIDNKEINGRTNNLKIELNLFLHFFKLNHVNDWFKNMLLVILPTLSRLLVIGEDRKECEYKLKNLNKFLNLDIILKKMDLPKKSTMKYSYDIYERVKDPDFQKCYTNIEKNKLDFIDSGVKALYQCVVADLRAKYANISQPYLFARKNNKFKPQRVRAFEMDELDANHMPIMDENEDL